jgi:hypothetical protein
MVAVSSEKAKAIVIRDRRRLEMIPGHDPDKPPFVYHAARALTPAGAERLVRESADVSLARATAAIRIAVHGIENNPRDVVATGILVGDRALSASLEAILQSHALVHAAEGELFRRAIRDASEALGIPVIEVRARDLRARAATALGASADAIAALLVQIGKAAGRPWTKDQKDACLAARIALSAVP